MTAPARTVVENPEPSPPKRLAYDPNNLHPLDAEDRRHDAPCDDIVDCDWDEIIATTQDDFLAGRYAFNSADYPTEEEAMIGLERLLDGILEKVLREAAAVSSLNAACR